MQYKNDFIGYNDPETIQHFSAGDNEDRYKHNLQSQADDWYYRFNEVTYNINKLGHRSKNIEDIDLDNYILFTGCSHAEGIGLELEKTFPYLTANDLGTDYYNLALGGSGIDVMTHNLMMWIHTIKKLPKALIIMWPQTVRFARLKECGKLLSLEVPSCATSPDDEEFIVIGDKINFFETVQSNSKKIINAAYTCKTIHLVSDILQQGDKARDLCHAGILSNRIVADQLVQNLKG